MTSSMGTANSIHWKNCILTPANFSIMARPIKLGGVPTGVPMPQGGAPMMPPSPQPAFRKGGAVKKPGYRSGGMVKSVHMQGWTNGKKDK